MTEKKSWQQHCGQVLDIVNGFEIIECELCEFIHIIPIPDRAELDSFYQTKFYNTLKPDYANQHAADREWWQLIYQERYERFEERLPKTRRKILDIGCGPGFFLQTGQQRGWDVLGIEPSSHAASYARQLGIEVIVHSFTDSLQQQLGQFDVIHINQALEHFPSPVGTVQHCHNLLKKKGLLDIVVANDYNPLQKILRDTFDFAPWWAVPPEHISYFTPESIERLFVSHGFQCDYKTTTFPMELFLLMGENYIGEPSIGKECHRRRKAFEFALYQGGRQDLKQHLYEAFCQNQIGREIEVIGIKS